MAGRNETEMAEKSFRELYDPADLSNPVEKLRLLCHSKGATGILALGRKFRRMEKDGKKHLDLEEFKFGLHETGIDLTEDEIKIMFEKFDRDKIGRIDMDEFLLHVRPPMSESRIKVLEEAFHKLDKAGDGVIPISYLRHVYNITANPRYQSGEESEERILKCIIDIFEEDATRVGEVTKEEFFNYYSGISASIDDDCYFDLTIRQSYKL